MVRRSSIKGLAASRCRIRRVESRLCEAEPFAGIEARKRRLVIRMTVQIVFTTSSKTVGARSILPAPNAHQSSPGSSRLSSFGGSSATPWEAIVRRKPTGSPFGPFSGISSASAIGDTCHILGPLGRGAGKGRYFCAPFYEKDRTLRSTSRVFRALAVAGLNRL
jgi:hypothetical protein